MLEMNRRTITRSVIIVLFILVVVSLFLIKIPYSISTYAKVKPAKQWMLIRGRDGEIISRMFNFESAVNEEYKVNYIARGDQASFVFNKPVFAKNYIERGDTVGYYNSSETNARYAQLAGELEEAKALLRSLEKGEKQAVVDEAKQKLNFARAKAEKQKILLKRLDSLYANNLVSEEEYELAEAEMNQLLYEIKISESQLEAVKTGVKPEEKQIVLNRINALRAELAVIEEKLKASIIKSPITGRINKVYSPDTLFNVVDENKFIFIIPVELSDSYHFQNNAKFSVENIADLSSDKIDFSNEVQILNSQQVRIASVVITNPGTQLISGMIIPCSITGQDLKLIDHIWNFLN